MNKTTAIIVTIVTALLCGCPGLALGVLGVMAAMGSQMPEVMAQNPGTPQEALLGSGIFICVSVLLILLPILVGFFSLRYAKPNEANINDSMPPLA